jgi:hypothetical protein
MAMKISMAFQPFCPDVDLDVVSRFCDERVFSSNKLRRSHSCWQFASAFLLTPGSLSSQWKQSSFFMRTSFGTLDCHEQKNKQSGERLLEFNWELPGQGSRRGGLGGGCCDRHCRLEADALDLQRQPYLRKASPPEYGGWVR